jgi:hypothetical protein
MLICIVVATLYPLGCGSDQSEAALPGSTSSADLPPVLPLTSNYHNPKDTGAKLQEHFSKTCEGAPASFQLPIDADADLTKHKGELLNLSFTYPGDIYMRAVSQDGTDALKFNGHYEVQDDFIVFSDLVGSYADGQRYKWAYAYDTGEHPRLRLAYVGSDGTYGGTIALYEAAVRCLPPQ